MVNFNIWSIPEKPDKLSFRAEKRRGKIRDRDNRKTRQGLMQSIMRHKK